MPSNILITGIKVDIRFKNLKDEPESQLSAQILKIAAKKHRLKFLDKSKAMMIQ